MKSVIVINGKPVDKSAIMLDELIKKHENVAFNVSDHVSKKVDLKDQVAVIFCSSGTTGLPKGVLITHNNIMSVLQGYRERIAMYKMVHGHCATNINVSPWFHAMGFMSMIIVSCMHETTIVFLPKYEDELFLRSIEVAKFCLNEY